MKNIKVAVIEDIEDIRLGFSYLINTAHGFECIGNYASAEEALPEIFKNKPDVIIMDIGLPGMTGIECTAQIKVQSPEIQIIICTVFEDDERLFNALAAGAGGYILKGGAPAILLDAILDIHNGGSPMTSQIARKVVASFQPSNAINNTAAVTYDLSTREVEILKLLANGFRNKEIAERLFISLNTVKSHIYRIYEKLHVKSRIEAINKFSKTK